MTLERIEKFLNAVKPEDQYNDFLKGKRVAIVGPSKHILLEKNGAKIDDYDIVIRLKWLPMKGFNIFKESIGDDTHVMYSSAVNRQKNMIYCPNQTLNLPDTQSVRWVQNQQTLFIMI